MMSMKPSDSAAAASAMSAGLHTARQTKITRKFKYPPMKLSIMRMPMFSSVERPVVMEFKILPVLIVWK